MKNIVLTGFMGTGKTAVGTEISRLIGRQLIDIDTEIERESKMTIAEIFSRMGEENFRFIETETIKKFSKLVDVIISTGGGAVLRQENIDALKENGIVICLTATPETIFKRTSPQIGIRPLLQVEDPLKRINELLDFRMSCYAKADFMIDTEEKTPLQIAEEIIEKARSL